MKMNSLFCLLFCPLMVFGLVLILTSSCKKENQEIPVLVTTNVSDITCSSASSGGDITSDGGSDINIRGVCWSTGQTPSISDNKTTDGSGAGNYSSNITGLSKCGIIIQCFIIILYF